MDKCCVICGKVFWATGSKITCSPGCSKKRHAQRAKLSYPPDYFKRYNEVNKERLRVQRRNYRRKNYEATTRICGLSVVCPVCGELGVQHVHVARNKNTGHVYTLMIVKHKVDGKTVEHFCSKKKLKF